MKCNIYNIYNIRFHHKKYNNYILLVLLLIVLQKIYTSIHRWLNPLYTEQAQNHGGLV